MLPASCWAEERSVVLSGTELNPLYEDMISSMPAVGDGGEMPLLASSGRYNDKDYPRVTSAESCAAVFRTAMKKRTTVRFRYAFKMASDVNKEKARAFINECCEEAFEHTGNPTEGEYIRWQYAKYDWEAVDLNALDRDYTCYFDVHFVYYTTAKQETAVANKIDEVLSGMNLADKDDYAIIKAVYDYIANNVSYDYDGLRNKDLTAHTAWKAMCKGTAVCQGYSLLMYRMLLQCGVDCRMVAADTGSTKTEDGHAWNLIELNDNYYYGDATWDAENTGGNYKYFLKGKSDFGNHAKFTHIYDYIKDHPVADSKYVPSSDETGQVIPVVKVLKKTSISKLTAGKRTLTVKWKKQQYGVKGYQIEYGTKAAFNNDKTTVKTIRNCDAISKKLTKLKSKTKYYVTVRTYKTIEDVDYYSEWSAKKSLTTK